MRRGGATPRCAGHAIPRTWCWRCSMRLVPAAARPSARRLCRRRPSGTCPPLQLRAVVGGLPGVGLELCTCRMSTERVPHRSDACDHGSERPTAEVKRGTSGAGGNMSSDSLSVADSLRTSSKGPRLANVASRLHFMYLRARLEGLEPPTNGFEGRKRPAQGVARLRNLWQLLRTRWAGFQGVAGFRIVQRGFCGQVADAADGEGGRCIPARLVGAVLAAFLGFVGYVRYGLTIEAAIAGNAAPVAPAGQRPFEILTAANFSDLREVFNAHAAEPRIVALLSPS